MTASQKQDARTLLEEVQSERRAETRTELESGYALEVGRDGNTEALFLEAPDGRICLTIRLDAAGPQLVAEGAALEVRAEGALRLAASELEVDVAQDITMKAGGNITTEGFAQTMRSTKGDIHVVANDDVRVDGERVRLNSPYTYRPPEDTRLMDMLTASAAAASQLPSDAG